MTSVLQDWVMELPLRFQGSLVVATRGCDVGPKRPTDAGHRQLVAYLRYCVLNPADPREVGIPGSFFQSDRPRYKASDFGHLPMHWYTHIMHAYEIVGYYHPEVDGIGLFARDIYMELAWNLHLPTESRRALHRRLTEDRIAANTVVT